MKKRSEKLYAILVSVLKNRPLKLLRAVEGKNGFEVWRQLSTQLTPKSRARSIALLQAYLNHPPELEQGQDDVARTVAWLGEVGR